MEKAKAIYEDGTTEFLTNKATEQTLSLIRMFVQAAKELAPQALQCAQTDKQRKRIKNIAESL